MWHRMVYSGGCVGCLQGLFEILDIDMCEEKQNLLVAICDVDCSGTIDEEVCVAVV